MNLGLNLGLGGQFGGFNPASALFGAGESGYWLDPSDFSTMFQDAAGTTPVTATGQSVRLMLDKSKGLVPGPELFANQASILVNVLGGATVIHTAATRTLQITVAGTSSEYPRLSVDLGMVVGKTYQVTGRIDGDRSLVTLVRLATSGVLNNLSYNSSTGVFSGIQVAGSQFINFITNGTITGTITIATISAREIPGNHFTQANVANAPLLQQDTSGRYFLLFDGSDDWLQSTATINPGSVDKAQVFAGVRKLSDASVGSLLAVSADPTANNGSFGILAPETAAANTYRFSSRGTALAAATGSGFVAPVTNVVTGLGDISGDSAILRVNGSQAAIDTTDQGTGNYLTYTHFIGRRGGTTLPFNGRLYQIITRYGANLTADQIAATETFVNVKTGAY